MIFAPTVANPVDSLFTRDEVTPAQALAARLRTFLNLFAKGRLVVAEGLFEPKLEVGLR